MKAIALYRRLNADALVAELPRRLDDLLAVEQQRRDASQATTAFSSLGAVDQLTTIK